MIELKFKSGELSEKERSIIESGFEQHSTEQSAPDYQKTRINWLAHDSKSALVGALTADLLWDWIYIDELWVCQNIRNQGLGKKLMVQAEQYADTKKLSGLWLWTQSWQAAEFYLKLGYKEFANFPDFPKGYSRIGLRKAF